MILQSRKEYTKQNFHVPISYYFLLAQGQYNEFIGHVLSLFGFDLNSITFFKNIGDINEEKLYHYGLYLGKIITEYEDNIITFKFIKA